MKKKITPFRIRSRSETKKKSKAKRIPKKVDQKGELIRALRLMQKIEEIKEVYKELDVITEKLLEQGFTEGFLDGHHIVMKDKFSVKNTVWKSTPQRRFELEIA